MRCIFPASKARLPNMSRSVLEAWSTIHTIGLVTAML